MKNRKFALYLLDILEAVKNIERYAKNLSFDDFLKDKKTIDAVIRNFEIIGEATKNVSKEVRSKYPEVPWRKMTSMRDRLIHEYFGVDTEILWKTIQEDLPQIKPLIKDILDDLKGL